MNLSQLRTALEQARVRPVKTLGQNFLHDQNLARWIVDQAQVGPEDFVLEIGPGLGALTGEILRRGARVVALEKDARLASFLRAQFAGARCEVRHCDALRFDVRELFPEQNVQLIGNLPYYVASQLLFHFTEFPSPISLSLLMLQDEMARRLSAAPRSPDYGSLTVRVQLRYRVEYLRKIPAGVFFPRPDVSSALVRLTPRHAPEVESICADALDHIIRRGFSQRRKQLRNLLARGSENWEEIAAKVGFGIQARAEELSREQWIALAELLSPEQAKIAPDPCVELFPVVDENDAEIGRAARAEVHANNLRHRAVHILVFNGDGEVLLQKRSPLKDRYPLLWDSSAAGHVEAGETYDATAGRELREELGIATDLAPVAKLPASDKTGQEFIWLYRARHDGPFQFPPSEISALKFFPAEVVDRWAANKPEDFAPGFLECWALARART